MSESISIFTKIRNGIERRLIQYKWYKDWQAKRSRKRIAKKSPYKDVDSNTIESYIPTAVVEKERARYAAIIAAREKQEADIKRQQEEADKAWNELVTAFGKNEKNMTQEERNYLWSLVDKAEAEGRLVNIRDLDV